MNTFQKEFIENLKFYRKNNLISQEKLAELCNCSTPTIGCIESAHQLPSFDMIVKIAKALNIHPADLFLRNASSTVADTKSILKSELLPEIEQFIDRKF